MLVLSRQEGESIRIGDIQVRIASIRGNKVRIAVNAPRDVPVHREEIYAVIAANGRAAAVGGGFKDASVPRGAEEDPAFGIRHSASGPALSTQHSAQAGGA